jgi:DNA-binding transcriptional MerR regulator
MTGEESRHGGREPQVYALERPWSEMPSYTIAELAEELGLTLRTLRFYEERGLLSPHREGGRRYYTADDRARAEAIVKARALGFTLAEIPALAAGWRKAGGLILTDEQSDRQMAFLRGQTVEIERSIAELEAMRGGKRKA